MKREKINWDELKIVLNLYLPDINQPAVLTRIFIDVFDDAFREIGIRVFPTQNEKSLAVGFTCLEHFQLFYIGLQYTPPDHQQISDQASGFKIQASIEKHTSKMELAKLHDIIIQFCKDLKIPHNLDKKTDIITYIFPSEEAYFALVLEILQKLKVYSQDKKEAI